MPEENLEDEVEPEEEEPEEEEPEEEVEVAGDAANIDSQRVERLEIKVNNLIDVLVGFCTKQATPDDVAVGLSNVRNQ